MNDDANQSDCDHRKALGEIVKVATTPDTNAVGTLPGGGVGALWSERGKENAFEEILRIARDALDTEGE